MLKKLTSLILSLIITASVFCMPYSADAKTYKQQLLDKGFPESYVNDLVALHEKYPKWVFEPFKTGLDWETAVSSERSPHRDQVLQKTSSRGSEWFCQCQYCSGKVQEGPSMYAASAQAVAYYMDPRNWLSEKYIFQFESTKYSSSQTQSGVEAIVSTTWMKNANITYNSTSGKTTTYKDSNSNTVKYSKAIIDAAEDSGMSAYYLASKIVQEVGAVKATTGGVCGTKDPFIGIYNYYNIGAYSGAMDGLQWASGFLEVNNSTKLYTETEFDTSKKEPTGQGTSVFMGQYASYISSCGKYYKVKLYNEKSGSFTTNGKTGYILKTDFNTKYFNASTPTGGKPVYGRPWTNPYKSIYYGAQYIAAGYLQYQYTGYLQKFNVNKNSSSLYGHEYMTNLDGAVSEAAISYRAYNNASILSQARTFYIPVYNNMPKEKCKVSANSSQQEEEESGVQVKGLTLDSRTKETLTFKWDKLEGATKYYLYIRNITKGTTFDKTVTTNSATLKGLTPANEYAVKVKAYTSKGWSDYSKENIKHALPDKMNNPKVKSYGAHDITLSWEALSGADGYYIYSYNSSNKKYTKLKTVSDGSATSAKVSSLKSSTDYKLCISAFTVDSKTKESSKTSKVSVKTKISGVKLKSLSSPSKTKIKATWAAVNGSEEGYQIYYARDKEFKKVVAKKDITSLSKSSYTGKNFTKGVTYYIKIRVYKTVDGKKKYGKWSNVKSVKSK